MDVLFWCYWMENWRKDIRMNQGTKQGLRAWQFLFPSFQVFPQEQENRWEQFLKDRTATKSILELLTSQSSSSMFHFCLYLTLMSDTEFVKRGGTEALKFLE